MPRLRIVEAWPATRHPGRPWHADPDVAAFLASSRGIFELYSDELPAAEQSAKASSVRFFVAEDTRPAGFDVSLLDRFLQSFDIVWVSVPQRFSELSAAARTSAALDVVHAAVRALGELRGWDVARLDEVRDRAAQRGLRYAWASGWRAAPGRRHEARGVYWLDDDGQGHVQLEIQTADGAVIARSEPVLAFMTSAGFARSAKTLRWLDAATVSLVPWTGIDGDEGTVRLDVAGPLMSSDVPAFVRSTDRATEVSVTVRTGNEWADDPDLPWIHVQGIDTVSVQEYGAEFSRASDVLAEDEDFEAWWRQAPYRHLLITVSVPTNPEWAQTPGARKNGKDLALRVVTEPDGLPPRGDVDALRARAREDLHAALVALARARKLPPPPPLPASVHDTRRSTRRY